MKRILAGAFFFFWLFVLPALAEVAVPPLQGRINDLTGSLDATTRQILEDKLAALEREKGAQLAVLLIPTTRPESIEQYGLKVAEAWKLGRKGFDDGALLLIAKEDRALRIETGYGLEGVIPDVIGKRIIEEIILPRFKAGDFPGGVNAGVDAMIARVRGEALAEPPSPDSGLWPMQGLMPDMMMLVLLAGGLIRIFFGRLLGAGIAAAIAFFGVKLLAGTWLFALLLGLAAFVLTLTGGGSSRGGLGGKVGGGGGGFRGGGGGFGGGGASGRW